MNYPRAPITEAVIELRYEQPLEESAVLELRRKFQTDYPFVDEQAEIEIEFQSAAAQVRKSSVGYKLADADQVNVVLLRPISVVTSRLAPYLGWEEFRERARDNWDRAKSVVGYRMINRLGIRFINRIDVPAEPGVGVEISNYLALYPKIPEDLPQSLIGYTSRVETSVDALDMLLVINTGQVPSPVLNHVSFLLDIDISKERTVPQQDSDIWKLVDSVRPEKNRIFESCVTDKARRLFSYA